MKSSKIIGLFISVVQLVSAVGLIVGMHAMLGVFATALPSGEQGIDIQLSDPVIIPFTLTPTNNGFIETSMDVRVGMLVDGVEVASDSASVVVPPGSMVPVDLELSISQADAQEYFQSATSLQWETDIKVSALYDLISFSDHMVIEGGVQ